MSTEIGSLIASLRLESAAFIRDMTKAARATKSNTDAMKRSLAGVEKSLSTAGNMLKAYIGFHTIRQIAAYTTATLRNAEAIREQASALGMAAGDLQAYKIIAERTGMSAEKFERALGVMARTIGQAQEGMGPLIKGLKDSNPELLKAITNAESMGEALKIMMAAIRDEGDFFEKARLQALFFGRGGQGAINLVTEATEENIQKLKELGSVVRDDTAEKLDDLMDSAKALRTAFDAGFTTKVVDSFTGQVSVTNDQIAKAVELGGKLGTVVGKSLQEAAELAAIINDLSEAKFTPDAEGLLTKLLGPGEMRMLREVRDELDRIRVKLEEVTGVEVEPEKAMGWLETWATNAAQNDLAHLIAIHDWLSKNASVTVIGGGVMDILKSGWDATMEALSEVYGWFDKMAGEQPDENGLIAFFRDTWQNLSNAVASVYTQLKNIADIAIPEGGFIAWLKEKTGLGANAPLAPFPTDNFTFANPADLVSNPNPHGLVTEYNQGPIGGDPTQINESAEAMDRLAASMGDWNTVTEDALGRSMELDDMMQEGKAIYSDMLTPMEEYGHTLDRINALQASGAISAETYSRMNQHATLAIVETALGAAGAMTGALAGLFKENKAFAIANAVINTAEAITAALKNPPGPPFSYVYAAAAAVAGAAQISTIMSSSPGGAKTPSFKGGAAGKKVSGISSAGESSGVGTGASALKQTVVLQITGESFGPEHYRKMVDGLNGVIGDGAQFRIER